MNPATAPVAPQSLLDHGNVKGAPVRAFLDFFALQSGEPAVQEAIRRLPDALRRRAFPAPHAPGYGVYASAWIPSEALGMIADDLLQGADAATRVRLAGGAARRVMNDTLRGVHKALFRTVASPELMLRNHMVFWRQQYDTGHVEIDTVDPCAQRHVVRDWGGHHPFVCEVTFACIPHMFRAMRLKTPRLEHYRCRDHHGGDRCEAIIRWDP